MAETAIRRKRAFLFFLVIALAGGLLQIFGEPRSRASELGAILLLACFLPASFFVFYLAKKRRLVPFPAQFGAGEPFVPHIEVDITLRDEQSATAARSKSERRGIFAVGQQGFTARFIVPPGLALGRGAPLRVEAQFLRPEVALPNFAVGSAFSLLQGSRIVGTGEVVRVLNAPA